MGWFFGFKLHLKPQRERRAAEFHADPGDEDERRPPWSRGGRAAATICCLQYNLLSVTRRFSDYETIGGLFREITRETVQLSVAQQI